MHKHYFRVLHATALPHKKSFKIQVIELQRLTRAKYEKQNLKLSTHIVSLETTIIIILLIIKIMILFL